MANREFILAQMKRLENNYTKERFKITQQMFDLWADMLGNLEEDGIKVSVDEYIRTNEYPPTVGSIVKIYEAKNEYRKEIASYLKSKYLWMKRWIEDKPNEEEYSEFCRYIMAYPREKRKEKVDKIVSEVIADYNKTQIKRPLKDWMGV